MGGGLRKADLERKGRRGRGEGGGGWGRKSDLARGSLKRLRPVIIFN